MSASRSKRRSRPLVVLLFPGAGTSADHASLVAIDDAITAAVPGAVVRRQDFPYRVAGRRAPDRAPVLVAAVREAAEQLAADAGVTVADLVIGGRSMGGRMCSMAVAEGLRVRGLFCVSYPLHPPGKPDKLRTEHFPQVDVPTLFVSGTRDTFGTREEFERHTPSLGGRFEQVWLDGGDHSLTRHGAAAAAAVVDWLAQLG